MNFEPSSHQKNFFRWVYTGNGSAILTAVAGSGKTTSIINALPLIKEDKHVQLLAFNTAIAKELSVRLEDLRKEHNRSFASFRAGTFHSVCFNAIRRHLGDVPVVTDSNKVRKILRNNFTKKEEETYGEFVVKLVGLAKGEGIGVLVKNEDSSWIKLINHHNLYIDSDDENANEQEGVRIAQFVLNMSNQLCEQGNIDYDDMLYMVLKWKLRLWQNDWVFVDEAQDTNPVRRAIIQLLLKSNGRMVAVGDPCQAIYGFTGASHDAIDQIKAKFNAIELPLTVSYRCATNIVKKAQEIVPYIEPFEKASEGVVSDMGIKEALELLTDRDAVLCRQTAPLISLAYTLIANQRPCHVLGREIGTGLISLVNRMKARSIDKLSEKLHKWRDREVKKWKEREDDQRVEMINDRFSCVMTIIDHLSENERTIPCLIHRIETMFTEDSSLLTLSTVHKAKGREWKNVAILAPELMPSKWARQPWQMQQERNLMYVAWTRAKENLIFLTDSSIVKEMTPQ